jgi:hypothetical protein
MGFPLEILAPKTGVLRNAGEHLWTNFSIVMEGPNEVGEFPSLVFKFDVRTALRNRSPSATQ